MQLVALLPLGDTTIVIADGRAFPRRGKPRARLVSALSQLAQNAGIEAACIHAFSGGGSGFKLRLFGVPEALRQRLRNVWAANRE